jgi:hypothetical protein
VNDTPDPGPDDAPKPGPDPTPDNAAQKHADAYRLAALDEGFMLGDSMRGVRFLLEYAKAEEHLRKWGVRSTVVVFGSARVRADADGFDNHRAAGNHRRTRWYDEARRFGRICSERGGALHPSGGG